MNSGRRPMTAGYVMSGLTRKTSSNLQLLFSLSFTAQFKEEVLIKFLPKISNLNLFSCVNTRFWTVVANILETPRRGIFKCLMRFTLLFAVRRASKRCQKQQTVVGFSTFFKLLGISLYYAPRVSSCQCSVYCTVLPLLCGRSGRGLHWRKHLGEIKICNRTQTLKQPKILHKLFLYDYI